MRLFGIAWRRPAPRVGPSAGPYLVSRRRAVIISAKPARMA